MCPEPLTNFCVSGPVVTRIASGSARFIGAFGNSVDSLCNPMANVGGLNHDCPSVVGATITLSPISAPVTALTD